MALVLEGVGVMQRKTISLKRCFLSFCVLGSLCSYMCVDDGMTGGEGRKRSARGGRGGRRRVHQGMRMRIGEDCSPRLVILLEMNGLY